MNPRLPLARLQASLFQRVAQRGLMTDVSLRAHLSSIGVDIDRSLFPRWRSGDREAPAGAFVAMLDHAGPEGALEILGDLAADYGGRVVEDTEGASVGTTTALMLRAIGEAGRLSSVVSEALADGEISDDERRAVEERLEAAAQTIASLRAQLASPALRVAR